MNIFTFAFKENLKQPINILIIILLPIAVLMIPGSPYGFPHGVYLVGLLIIFSAYLISRPLVEDRMKGIIHRIEASPVTHMNYLSSHLAAYFIVLMFQSLVFIVGTLLFHGESTFNHWMIYSLYLSFGFMCLTLTLAFTSFFHNFALAFGIYSGFGSLMSLLGGISMPLYIIPEKIIPYIRFLPTYWLPYGLNSVYESEINGFLIAHAVLLIYAGIFLLIGSKRRN